MHSHVNEQSPSTKQEDLYVTSSLRKVNLICIQSRMSVYASQLLCVFVCECARMRTSHIPLKSLLHVIKLHFHLIGRETNSCRCEGSYCWSHGEYIPGTTRIICQAAQSFLKGTLLLSCTSPKKLASISIAYCLHFF